MGFRLQWVLGLCYIFIRGLNFNTQWVLMGFGLWWAFVYTLKIFGPMLGFKLFTIRV